MKFIDLFSGIGGFRSALEELGHECIAFSEIDKFAIKSYKAIYDTDGEIELGNISEISDEYISKLQGEVDLVVGGSPCQSFSVAGNRGGFEDTRGTLFFDYARTVSDIKPKYFIYENVKGMISHDKSNTVKTVLNTFNELGYYIDFNIFNSKYYGVPQNRERIYIVGKRKDLVPSPKFHEKKKRKVKVDEIHNWAVEHIEFVELLPELKSNVDTRLIDVLEDDVDESFYLTKKQTQNMSIDDDLSGRLNQYNFRERDIIHSPYKVSPTLNTMQGGDRQPKIAIKSFKEIVEVRKYEVPIEELQKILRESKDKTKLTINQISTTLDIPKTKVEHWFRTDSSFSIPDREVWYKLKHLLEIETSEFDKAITEFVLKESEFDTTNRVYDPNHLSPTINSTTEPKIAVVGNTSRTNHNSHNIYDSDGLAPTISARDYKGPKQVLEYANFLKVVNSDINYYAYDDYVISENAAEKIGKISDNHYAYIDPKIIELRNNLKLIINNEETQAEILMKTEDDGVYRSLEVFNEFDDEITSKISFGRFGKQAVETLVSNIDVAKYGDTINAFNRTLDTSGISPTLTTRPDGFKTAILPVTKEIRIRKLTPLECWRLQGFSDEQFDKAQQAGLSNSQLYKQAGNAVTVNVVKYIADHLLEED